MGSLLALGINGIIGVGIFFAPSQVARVLPGLAGLWVYLLVGSCLFPVALCYAKLGARFAENGGPYVWAERAFGPPAAFFIGWLTYVSGVFSAAAVVSGLATHLGPWLGASAAAQQRVLCVLLVVGLSSVVLAGLRPTARVWSFFAVAKLVPLGLLLLTFAFGFAGAGPSAPLAEPGAPADADWLRAALIVVFALQGFEVVPVLAREARRPSRAIPISTLGSLLFVLVLYLGIHWVCVQTLPGLARSERPLVDAGTVLGGPRTGHLLLIGTNVSGLGIAFGMFAVLPYYLAVLGHLPGLAWLARESSGHLPRRAVVLTALFVAVFGFWGDLGELLVLSSVAVMSQYAVCGLSLLRLAQLGCAGLTWRDAWPTPLALFAVLLLLQGATVKELSLAALVLALGAVLYLARRRQRS